MSAYKLKKYISPYRCGDAMGIRVRIECETSEPKESGTKLSPKIFAYLPQTDGGHFNHVCNVIDLKECPEDRPSSGKWPKWYRLNYVDLYLPNVDVAYDFIQKVEDDVADLYRTMVKFNKIVNQEPVEVIIPPENASDFDVEEEESGDDGQTG